MPSELEHPKPYATPSFGGSLHSDLELKFDLRRREPNIAGTRLCDRIAELSA
jgi:hypothetical protein